MQNLSPRLINLIALAALALGCLLHPPTVAGNDNITWLITVCEHMLDGQKLYLDILEANPPASVWMYLPAVALARVLHLRPESLITFQFLALTAFSLFLTAKLLRRAKLLPESMVPLGMLATAILVLLPTTTFGEREHADVLLLLPLFAALSLRLQGQLPTNAEALLCGVMAGLALAIKPYFVLQILGALAVALYLTREWRLIFARENWVAGGVAGLYLAAVLLFAPDFINSALTDVALSYVPIREPLMDLILSQESMIWATSLGLLLVLATWRGLSKPALLLIAASCGGFIAFLGQGKNWPYQALPMELFTLLALSLELVNERPWRPMHRLVTGLGLVLLMAMNLNNFKEHDAYRDLRAAVQKLQPHPSMITIAFDISIGHPLVRQVEGTWVGRVCSMWRWRGAKRRLRDELLPPETIEKLEDIAARDQTMLTEDIVAGKPDIVLVATEGFDFNGWISQTPDLKNALAPYQLRGTVNGVRILKR